MSDKRSQALVKSERRNTVYSDSHSLEQVRGGKPAFSKPERKAKHAQKKKALSHSSRSKSNRSGSARN